jgi:uncharacterized protein YdeI (YjbR/CyaY-like superfamily)
MPSPALWSSPRTSPAALYADPVARTAYGHLSYGHQRQHVRAIESAKKPEMRARRIEKAVVMLRNQEPAGGLAARAKTQGEHP